MSGGLQRLQLQIDKSREDFNELEAYEDYLEEERQKAKERKRGGLFGSIIGAVGGFLLGGPAGLIAGLAVGGQGGKWIAAHDDYSDSKKELAKEVFKGGKFNWKETQNWAEDQKRYAKDLQNSYLLETGITGITAGIGISQAGGFMDEAAKEAWKSMTFGEQIASLGVTGTGTEAASKAGTQELVDKALAGEASLFDVVKHTQQYAPGVKGQFVRNVGKGLRGLSRPGSEAYDIAKHLSLDASVKRSLAYGDVDLSDLVGQYLGEYMFGNSGSRG